MHFDVIGTALLHDAGQALAHLGALQEGARGQHRRLAELGAELDVVVKDLGHKKSEGDAAVVGGVEEREMQNCAHWKKQTNTPVGTTHSCTEGTGGGCED